MSEAISEQLERELKFDAPLDWTLLQPEELAPSDDISIERAVQRLVSTYFDTEDRALLRHRLTLRRRSGDADAGWQLKVPAGDARTELRVDSGSEEVPAELADATLGVRGGADAQPVATLVTARDIHRLRAADWTPLAEVVVDTVTATVPGASGDGRHWREVEVELLEGGDEQLLSAVGKRLTTLGATPSPSVSKLARALGVEAPAAPDLSTMSGLALRYLRAQTDAIVRGDIALRRGRDPDAIHDTRVATRRYRSELRVLGKLFDPERAAALVAELTWFAAVLGQVRDCEVLRAHLAQALDQLEPELAMGPVSARITQTLHRDETEARERLAEAANGQRYFELLAELGRWREGLPIIDDKPAKKVATYLRKAEKKMANRVAGAPDAADADEALHRARKAAKRARYTAELSRPVLGADAKAAEERLEAAQDRLGLRQDCILAAEFLRRLGAAAGAAGENGFAYGVLRERVLAQAHEITG